MKGKYRLLALIAFVLVIVDQATKQWVVRYFGNIEGRSEEIIPGVFDLVLTRNPGAAWGMLGGLQPDSLRIGIFVLISIGAVAMVLWLARRARPGQYLLIWSLGLVLAGALGNLVDRIVEGRVVDFLDFYTHAAWFDRIFDCGTHGCHWPAFNVADMCISTGVGLLILETFLSDRREKKEAATAAAGQEPPSGPAQSSSSAHDDSRSDTGS